MFPGQMRRPWRREVFLIVFCLVCFIIQISLTTQVWHRTANTQQIYIGVEIHLSVYMYTMSLWSVVQGGVYLFQLTDHYAANGACILFVGLLQCGAVGWGFGKS